MKINLIIPSFYPATVYGGPIFSTLHTSQELAKLKDCEIYVSTTNANMETKLDVETNSWKKFEDNLFVKYYNTTVKHTISLPMFFLMWQDIKQADVIHLQSVYNFSAPFALLYAKIFKKPVLLSPRGQFGGWCLENGSRFKQLWLDLLIKPFKKIITWHATAEQEKNEILTICPNTIVEVVSNGIEYDLFQKSSVLSKQTFMKKYTDKEIETDNISVSMGRLQKKKGFDILINSFVKVLERYPKATLFIAGQNEGEENNLKQQVNELKLADKVFLVGAINGQDKIDFLANADLFVLPSHNENFGNVYVESLAAGTPIVASKNTPWSEVEEADCGKWVNNSVKETTQAILEMLEKDREKMRVNAKALAKKYDWKNIAVQFKEVFERMYENATVNK
jgi:glycosyltransferase involved in cell wall biosynthesis